MWGSSVGTVVRALASHQCGPGSIPGPGVICGLSLLLFSTLLREVFLRVLRFSPLLKNQYFQIPVRSWNARTFLNEFLWTPWCYVGGKITFTLFPIISYRFCLYRGKRFRAKTQCCKVKWRFCYVFLCPMFATCRESCWLLGVVHDLYYWFAVVIALSCWLDGRKDLLESFIPRGLEILFAIFGMDSQVQ